MDGYDLCARGGSIVNRCSLLIATAQVPSAYTPGLKGEGEDGSSLFEILGCSCDIPTVADCGAEGGSTNILGRN